MKISDLLVIETGPGIAGPYVTRILRDLGARVIKVESSTRLDFFRARIPPPGKSAADAQEAPGVIEMSAGKESVALDLKTEAGREIFLRLLERADVYVENYAPGWLERLGLSVERFVERNPRLVILSQSAYGQDGPRSGQRAYAPLMTALAGVESLVGYEDGRVVPQVASAAGDIVAAHFGILLVQAALYERERTGRGVSLDMSQTETSVAVAGIAFAEYGLSGNVPRPQGNRDPRVVPRGVYPARGDDQWVAIEVWTDDQWDRLAEALDLPAADRRRFARADERARSVDEVDALVRTHTARLDRDALFHALQGSGVACTPVLDTYASDELPALRERGLWTAVEHPRTGALRLTEIPWHFQHTEIRSRGYGDAVGASTDRVLAELLGAGPDEIAAWRAAGVLA